MWENNKKMGLQEIQCESMDRVHLAEDRNKWWAVVVTVMNFQMLYRETSGFLIRTVRNRVGFLV